MFPLIQLYYQKARNLRPLIDKTVKRPVEWPVHKGFGLSERKSLIDHEGYNPEK